MPKRPERRIAQPVSDESLIAQGDETLVMHQLDNSKSGIRSRKELEDSDPDAAAIIPARPIDAIIALMVPEEAFVSQSWKPTQQMVLSPIERLRYQLLVEKRAAEQLKQEIRRRDADKLQERISHLATKKALLAEQAQVAQLRAQLAATEVDAQVTTLAEQRKDALKDVDVKSTFPEEWKAVSADVKARLEIPEGYSMSLDMETGSVSVEKEN